MVCGKIFIKQIHLIQFNKITLIFNDRCTYSVSDGCSFTLFIMIFTENKQNSCCYAMTVDTSWLSTNYAKFTHYWSIYPCNFIFI